MYAINRLCRELERAHTVQRICVENSHNKSNITDSTSTVQCNMQRFLMWFLHSGSVLVHLYALPKMNMRLLARCSFFHMFFSAVLFGSLGSRFFPSSICFFRLSFFLKWKNTLYTYRLTPSSCNDRASARTQPTCIKFVFVYFSSVL